jgi:hypothetical protein
MIDPAGAAPGQGSLAERANQALLVLADRADQKKSETELNAIATACARAEALTSRLQAASHVAVQFNALRVSHVRRPIPSSAAKAIPNLRAAATRAADPGQDLTERLRSGAVQDGLKAAETTAKLLEQGLVDAADAERLRLTPSDLNSPTATMPGSESLQAQIRKIQSSFSQRFSGPVSDLPATIGRWRQSAAEWEEVREELKRAMAELPPEIKEFVEAAGTSDGAPWSIVTAAVRDWLDLDGHGEGYEVRKW